MMARKNALRKQQIGSQNSAGTMTESGQEKAAECPQGLAAVSQEVPHMGAGR